MYKYILYMYIFMWQKCNEHHKNSTFSPVW